MINKLSDEQIEDILKDNVWGHLGCSDRFNTYVYPINFLYDGKFITCHSQQGSKIQVMQQNTRVCFQIDEVKNDRNWKSVMVHGEYQQLFMEEEYNEAMKAFTDRRLFLKTSEASVSPETNSWEDIMPLYDTRPAIFRIVIDEKYGRCENG